MRGDEEMRGASSRVGQGLGLVRAAISRLISMVFRISSASFLPSAVATSRLPWACVMRTSMFDLDSISCTRAWHRGGGGV